MFKILGVDPGSVSTGYGLVKVEGDGVEYIASGVISLQRSLGRYDRLKEIFLDMNRIIQDFSPTHLAVEEVFYSKNAKSALVLGEVRGMAVLAASLSSIPIFEYSSKEVKQAITGHGAAKKSQVSYMLGKILNLSEPPVNMDESDALAVAVCHAFRQREWSTI